MARINVFSGMVMASLGGGLVAQEPSDPVLAGVAVLMLFVGAVTVACFGGER